MGKIITRCRCDGYLSVIMLWRCCVGSRAAMILTAIKCYFVIESFSTIIVIAKQQDGNSS